MPYVRGAGRAVNVLIVESRAELAGIWRNALIREGADVWVATGGGEAVALLEDVTFDVIVLEVVLEEGSALAIADLASYRQPECKVVFVTNTTFFSDGTIFNYVSNAAAFLPSTTAPDDLAKLVEHHGTPRRPL
ncbi:response regulator [Roseivivax marinus]|uniref:response regulator n=1 Tax=Roseivivax marinus TaxID=1379903 RepID=UPI00273EA5D2|nr:response regulator [Roseivivax marinus]